MITIFAASLSLKTVSPQTKQRSFVRGPEPVQLRPSTGLLMALPEELRIQILNYLSPINDEPTLAILRRTSCYFYNLISAADVVRNLCQEILTQQLQNAENLCPFLFPPSHFPCYTCLSVLPVTKFEDRVRTPCIYDRVCLACGVGRHRYRRGETVAIDGVRWMICSAVCDLSNSSIDFHFESLCGEISANGNIVLVWRAVRES